MTATDKLENRESRYEVRIKGRHRAASLLFTVLLTALFGIAATPAAAATCAGLAGLTLPDTEITVAAAGGAAFGDLPRFAGLPPR